MPQDLVIRQGKDSLKSNLIPPKSAFGFHSWKKEHFRNGLTPKWNAHSQFGYSTGHLAPSTNR